ncbi:PREDICTED: integrin alpha-PS1 [Ceratosolen solmsi marchali]|uniref:Integrin alpha-PS1 n=1 Tax=Ceratosolen solmsi marchali TaxID=326594 RepID=A0AAJ6YX32_9HYME|nr:PREDICTED: integrin alpha-PS1 [Ceratosolen solmsi marchali]
MEGRMVWTRAYLLLATLLWELALGFNLEARIPVLKRGASGSYFGFSVAEHQEDRGDTTPRYISWMLIGAPLDQNRQPGTNRSGALWQCPMTTNSSDCEQIITDGRISESSQYESSTETDELTRPSSNEVKDGQWLGVTVRSAGIGGKVMVCAHRYIVKNKDSQWGQGQCYIFTQDLKYQELKKPCSGKPTIRAHEQFGYCQAGTSGVLTSTDNYAVIGTPGPHTWRGTLYVITVSDDFIHKDTVVYSSPMQEDSPVSKYSYLGMSVTVGDFFGSGLAYAAGAPRSNGTGQVVLFTRHFQKPIMEITLTLNGEQFASSFGYELASADVNGDKQSDLIVAAPFYYGKKEGGAVYVYTKLCKNPKDGEKCKPTKLIGREESRFGFALTNLRDINNDGFEDIAVGAPYEGMGTVYIYLGSKNGLITVPSQVIHSESTPVPLKTFGYSLSGGLDMDLNGYPDLLVGAYEEDAIALLRARRIIDIITFVRFPRKDGTYQDKMEPIDPNKIGCFDDPLSNYTCFSFEACCKTASHVKEEYVRSLKLMSYIEAETYAGTKKFSRMWFGDGNNRPHFLSRIATLDSKNLMYCQRETVYLKENTRDIQSPVKFRLNYTLIQDEPVMPPEGAPMPDINNYPILNQQEAARIFEATFQKDCGNNDICESDLRLSANLNLQASPTQRNYYELLLGESEELVVDVNITNVGESAYEAQLFLVHSPSLSYIGTKQNDSAICSLHNSTVISCAIGNPFKKDKSVNIQIRFDPKYVEDSEVTLEFVAYANSTSKEVSAKKPTHLQATVLKRAELSVKGSAKTQWALYGGSVIGESAMKKLNDVGPKVAHVYQIFNDGPWKVSKLDVLISWPYEVANDKHHGKWLLYLEDTPIVQAPGGERIGECHVPAGQVNSLNLQSSIGLEDIDPLFPQKPLSPLDLNQTNHIRRRRDTEKVIAMKIMIDRDGHHHQVVTMNCKTGTAKCFDITCSISSLQKKEEATIIVKARLWNSTLAEDYPKVDRVNIGSSAKIIIPQQVIIQQNNLTDDTAEAITIAYPDLLDQQEPEPVPIWIIIVAVVAGLLLLILLTLILWKLGFFNRRRPDHTLSGNLQKHREDNPENEALVKHSANLH